MRTIEWTDEKGFKRKRMIQNNDPDNVAKDGIPLEPPDLTRLDWNAIVAELHNNLMDRGLVTWKDVQLSQNGVTGAILSTLKNKIIKLYREV